MRKVYAERNVRGMLRIAPGEVHVLHNSLRTACAMSERAERWSGGTRPVEPCPCGHGDETFAPLSRKQPHLDGYADLDRGDDLLSRSIRPEDPDDCAVADDAPTPSDRYATGRAPDGAKGNPQKRCQFMGQPPSHGRRGRNICLQKPRSRSWQAIRRLPTLDLAASGDACAASGSILGAQAMQKRHPDVPAAPRLSAKKASGCPCGA